MKRSPTAPASETTDHTQHDFTMVAAVGTLQTSLGVIGAWAFYSAIVIPLSNTERK